MTTTQNGEPVHSFDKNYWEKHWDGAKDQLAPTNPYIVDETRDLTPGTALDAGCGTGTEALWLARQGWQVTGADISSGALTAAAEHARRVELSDRVTWTEADLSTWSPQQRWDLVVTNYAHPSIPQLEFYRRIADWVAPGGTLIIVGHLHDPQHVEAAHDHGHGHGHGHGHNPPEEATATPTNITAVLDAEMWHVDTARENTRTLTAPDGREKTLRDVVVRATRRA